MNYVHSGSCLRVCLQGTHTETAVIWRQWIKYWAESKGQGRVGGQKFKSKLMTTKKFRFMDKRLAWELKGQSINNGQHFRKVTVSRIPRGRERWWRFIIASLPAKSFSLLLEKAGTSLQTQLGCMELVDINVWENSQHRSLGGGLEGSLDSLFYKIPWELYVFLPMRIKHLPMGLNPFHS